MEIDGDNKVTGSIRDFYKNQSIFITGATGFMGKVLLEKLLRSCSDIDTVYILMRPKKGMDIAERADKLLSDIVFQRLDKAQKSKVIPLPGDLNLLGLGLSDETRQLLIKRVSIVFHVAATVSFAEGLRETLITNLRATSEVLQLCKTLTNLKTLLYVSTAYAHCLRKDIHETIYEIEVTPEYMLGLIETMSESQMEEEIAPRFVKAGWPNFYTLSKALAENLIKNTSLEVPVAIFRPSMVMSTLKEPLPGWNDNFNGPTGLVAGGMMGIIRTIICDTKRKMGLVPCDLAINAMIVSAAQVAAGKQKCEATVFNFTADSNNPVTEDDMHVYLLETGIKAPPSKAMWYYMGFPSTSYLKYKFLALFLHFIPALLIDTVAMLTGQKRRMVRLYSKIDKFILLASWFGLREWNFNNGNVYRLILNSSSQDLEEFPCDVRTIKWKEYMETYYLGIRRYLLKDPDDTIPEAVVRYQKLLWMHRGLQSVLAVAVIGFISRIALPMFA